MEKRRSILAVFAILLLLVAACGGDATREEMDVAGADGESVMTVFSAPT